MAAGGAGRSRSPGTCSRRVRAAMCRSGRRTHSSRRPSTALPPASTPSSRSSAYRAPALVAEMLADAGVEASRSLDVARCGMWHRALRAARRTVRTAPRRSRPVRGDARASPRAERLRRAGQAGADRVPARLPGAFDVIVSADTLVYFGALEEVVAAAAKALRPGGVLVFTVEELCAAPGRRRVLPQPERALSPCARLCRARARGCGSSSRDRPGRAAPRGRRAGPGLVVRATAARASSGEVT